MSWDKVARHARLYSKRARRRVPKPTPPIINWVDMEAEAQERDDWWNYLPPHYPANQPENT